MQDSIGDRFKAYEDSFRIKLPKRLPVIIRLDGKAFHSVLRKYKKFDDSVIEAMKETSLVLFKEVPSTKLIFSQSDEISLLLINYGSIHTEPWFDNNLQKLVSISSSFASLAFSKALNTKAVFDARAFVLPKEEVNNYFYWRQLDAVRNSVQMLAQSLYSHKELQNKNAWELQELCFQKGNNWNDLPTHKKRGFCVVKDEETRNIVVDLEIPIFSKNTEYVNNYVFV